MICGLDNQMFWHPFGVLSLFRRFPVVCASLRPPATFFQPFGLRNARRMSISRNSSHTELYAGSAFGLPNGGLA